MDGGGSSSSSFIPFPWLKAISAATGGPTFPGYGAVHHSAPVTPPTGSPPHLKMARWADNRAPAAAPLAAAAGFSAIPPWVTGAAASSGSRYASQPSYTTPPSPGGRRRARADPATWMPVFQAPSSAAAKGKAPAFSFAPPVGTFGSAYGDAGAASSSRLRVSGQSSCTLSPAVGFGGAVAARGHADTNQKAEDAESDCTLSLGGGDAMVRAWEGEVVKECSEEELELTLGSSRTRADRA